MRDQSSIARSGQRDAAGDRGLQTQPTEIGSSAAVGIRAAGLYYYRLSGVDSPDHAKVIV